LGARESQGAYWLQHEGAAGGEAAAAAAAAGGAIDFHKGVQTLRAAIHGGAGPGRERVLNVLSELLREAADAQVASLPCQALSSCSLR